MPQILRNKHRILLTLLQSFKEDKVEATRNLIENQIGLSNIGSPKFNFHRDSMNEADGKLQGSATYKRLNQLLLLSSYQKFLQNLTYINYIRKGKSLIENVVKTSIIEFIDESQMINYIGTYGEFQFIKQKPQLLEVLDPHQIQIAAYLVQQQLGYLAKSKEEDLVKKYIGLKKSRTQLDENTKEVNEFLKMSLINSFNQEMIDSNLVDNVILPGLMLID